MKNCKALSGSVTVILTALLAPPAMAQAGSPSGPGAVPDLAAGQQIATTGNPAKGVIACVTCHGAVGEGNAASGFPRLAGQSAWYMSEQLDSYADGRRKNPIMEPIAKALSDSERRAVSAYYAGLKTPAATASPAPGTSAPPAGTASPAPGTSPPPAATGAKPASPGAGRGETLYVSGDESLRVQGCVNCHGPGGVGEPPTYPYLAGQHASYLASALREFKNGTRTNDPSGQMPYIARQLSDSDIDAVSAYLAQLPLPQRDDAATAAIRQRAREGANTPSARQSGPSAPTGTGTEQGAPLTGGSQGPGGGGGGSGTGPSGSSTGH
jgi:cytochrome c553